MLAPPDTHYILAATGWLELGNTAEAEAELAQLSAAARMDPDVLELKWLICARRGEWEEGLKVAQNLLRVAPKRCTGWLHRAYALRRLPDGSLQEAWEALLPAYRKFPRESLISYNLSCYACQMGNMDEARKWFRRAVDCGGLEAIKKIALADEDLLPLRDEILKMT